jgi:hypothetical protein
VPIASVLISPFTNASLASGEDACPRGLFKADDGTRCWIMVLLTAYLKLGWPPAGDDSEISERRMVF